ncbi:MAG: hypothetical protein KAT11_06770 [Phycisphaerae bacterium]|nr:hypothetical protein [Phycisphaerae bacterium]
MLRKTMRVVALMAAVMGLGLKVSPVLGQSESRAKEPAGKVSLNKLVQQLMDARINYGENLHRLIEYYKKMGNSQGEDWAKRELKEFGKIRQGKYLAGLKGKLAAVNTEALGQSDIVESLVGYRQAYRKSLEALVGVLKGAKDVKQWMLAERELRELISVNKYMYLRDADTPGVELRAKEKIDAAEKLYAQAMELKKHSKGFRVRRYETQAAMEGFRRLIRGYPSSDRIDDAAYQIGELCRDNLKDYQRAIRWYECVVAWNADTQLQANLRIAQIYDKRLVNRLTALDYYRRALEIEARGSSERKRIERRINKLRGR